MAPDKLSNDAVASAEMPNDHPPIIYHISRDQRLLTQSHARVFCFTQTLPLPIRLRLGLASSFHRWVLLFSLVEHRGHGMCWPLPVNVIHPRTQPDGPVAASPRYVISFRREGHGAHHVYRCLASFSCAVVCGTEC